MTLLIYNSLTRTKETFAPVNPGRVGIYLCGPTVYKPSHLGHAVGPIIFDAIKRYLTYRGFEVEWVVNITDVDDKLIIEAKAQGITAPELARRVEDDYLKAMDELGVRRGTDGIDRMPKASEHIKDICDLIQRLIDKDMAYASGGDVYFDVSKDSDYGKLSNRRAEEQETGLRELKSGEKRNPGDFALWKAAKPDEPEEVKYESPWGMGRPGWHIECSAMAMKYLGETFDIHGGGLDLIFPHHENEVAQSECATGKAFSKYWMHHGLTRANTKKISKSASDEEGQRMLRRMTLHNLLEECTGEHIRFFVLSTHYRRPIEFSDAELESKKKGLESFYRLFERVERLTGTSPYAIADPSRDCKGAEPEPQAPVLDADSDRGAISCGAAAKTSQGSACANASVPATSQFAISAPALVETCDQMQTQFEQAMDDDFNTAGAIATLFDYASAINRVIDQEKLESGGSDELKQDVLHATSRLIGLSRLLGLFEKPPARSSAADNGVAGRAMEVLIEVRQHLRKKKDFESADLIRNMLSERKITLEDRPDGTIWRSE